MGNSILYRMPSGIPGAVSRPSQSTIEPAMLDPNNPFPSYGLFGKIVSGKLVPIGSGDTAANVYSLLVRAYPTNSGQDPLGAATPPTKGVIDNMRRGYMTVKVNAGTAAQSGQVYVRVANAATGKPIGGIEAAADSTNTIAVNATFMSAADASGNVEIAFNI
ncbi:hypothetical protein [Chromobacterium violaceum]|uniref:structural cement protein Gp24 n=1 Tax=Chromobacterium violaceum TaxID=536 RepID=UPI0005BBE3E2|nr:hypothetical protein [Chromobacterium violaceum]